MERKLQPAYTTAVSKCEPSSEQVPPHKSWVILTLLGRALRTLGKSCWTPDKSNKVFVCIGKWRHEILMVSHDVKQICSQVPGQSPPVPIRKMVAIKVMAETSLPVQETEML